jgi:cytochrome c5
METMNSSVSSAASADNDPADLFKSTANLLVKVAIVAAVVIGTIILLAVTVAPDGARNRDMSEQAVAARIQKVGTLVLGDAAGSGPRSGEDLYKGRCAACHGAGLLGAPKLADKAAWGPRVASGYAALLSAALKGKNAMPAQGGADYSDAEVGRALVYMANLAGANFAEPEAEAGSAAAAPLSKNAKP